MPILNSQTSQTSKKNLVKLCWWAGGRSFL